MQQATSFRPIIGAIRWDAWHGERGGPGRAVQRALGPAIYHDRIPFFGKVRGEDDVTIDGIDPEVMEREIGYAVRAGLGYWAYVTYDDGNEMSLGIELHLKSKRRAEMPFCLIVEAPRMANPAIVARVRRIVNEAGYLRVLGGRPVIYLGFIEEKFVDEKLGGVAGFRAAIDQLRSDVTREAGSNPYIVLMEFDPWRAKKWVSELGLDATSQYAVGGEAKSAPFSELTEKAERRWNQCRELGMEVVPIITSGWDRRPRIARPMPWETWQTAGVGIDICYAKPTREELAAHVRRAIEWMGEFDATTPAKLGIIYAWNENDEGGWLTPTLRADGTVDEMRVEALAGVLGARVKN